MQQISINQESVVIRLFQKYSLWNAYFTAVKTVNDILHSQLRKFKATYLRETTKLGQVELYKAVRLKRFSQVWCALARISAVKTKNSILYGFALV